jgi:rfaE bifunctional protein kinase chain/domain
MKNLDIRSSIKKIKEARPEILVFGDAMLDHYVFGEVERISPEAPVPILNYKNEKYVLGGAGNVVHNLVNMGAKVHFSTILGNDTNGDEILGLLKKIRIPSDKIFLSKNINTTKKTRFLSGGSQLLRLDSDSRGLSEKDFGHIKNILTNNSLMNLNAIIISDYNKGICSKGIIQFLIKAAKIFDIPVFIDPKGLNWSKYSGATCITPNVKEMEGYLNVKLISDSDFKKGAERIMRNLKIKSCLITKGAEGMVYFDNQNSINQAVVEKEVFDVSGAGDTVIACFSASLASKVALIESLKLSSMVSSEVVTHIGTTPFNIEMLSRYG